MSKIFKRLTAAVVAGMMAMSLTMTASSECSHTTIDSYIREPYFTRDTTHEHEIGRFTENDVEYVITKECIITTKYGILYNVCHYCRKTMSYNETYMGETHSVKT